MSSVSVAQASARGTLILFIGNLVSTLISTGTIIVFARLLGPSGYGVYTLAFVVPAILQLFVGFGVSTAVTRYVAFSLSTGDAERAASMTRTAMVFCLLFGLAMSVANLVAMPYFDVVVLHRPELVQYTQMASVYVAAVALSQVATSALIGWGSMIQVSAFAVLQASFKIALGVALILAGWGVLGAIDAHVASYLVQGLVAGLAIYLLRIRLSAKHANAFSKDVRAMVGYGLPVFGGGVVSGLAAQYSTVILASVVADTVIGYYQAAINVTVAITVISAALANVLFRSFAELHGLEEDISLAFAYAVRYVSFILTPVVFFIIASAGPLVGIFYGAAYSQAVELLRLVAVSYLPVAIGLTVLPSFLNGVGRSSMNMWVSFSGSAALVVASLVFVLGLRLGAEGLVFALLVSNMAIAVPGLILARVYLHTHVPVKPLAGLFGAGFVAWLAVVVLPLQALSSVETVVVQGVVYVAAYLVLVPLFFGLETEDLVRLSIAVETLGPLRVIFALIIGLERRLLLLRRGGASDEGVSRQ